jgi:hypothetical protein
MRSDSYILQEIGLTDEKNTTLLQSTVNEYLNASLPDSKNVPNQYQLNILPVPMVEMYVILNYKSLWSFYIKYI